MSEPTPTAPKTDLTVSEVIGSVTGYEEDAIASSFGMSFDDLDPVKTVRALVFVVERRKNGTTDKTALKAAQALSRSDVMEYFTPSEEPFPEDPVTPAGND